MDRNTSPGELADALGDWVSAPGPRYRTLADALANAARSGVLVRGDRLPSERRFAARLALSRSTVVAAYAELRARGLVDSRRGSGTVVVGAAAAIPGLGERRLAAGAAVGLRQRMVDRSAEVITLTEAADGAVPDLAEQLHDLADRELDRLVHDAGYHPRGLPELRHAVADHYTSVGVPTVAEQVLVTTGATQAIGLAAQLYLHRRARVVVETPSWPGCTDIFGALDAETVGVPIDSDGIRTDLLHAVFARGTPDLVFVMPTFHNPTGVLMSEGRRGRLAQLCARRGVPLIEDIAYCGHPGPPPVAAFAPGAAEVLSIGGLAKTVWGGLRVGWARGSPDTIDRLSRLKALADLGSAVLDQALAARYLPRIAELDRHRAVQHRMQLAQMSALLSAALPSWRWRPPDGGTALWVELPDSNATAFAAVALRHGVELVPGSATDRGGDHDAYLRLPYTFPEPIMADVVRRLTDSWAEFTAR